MAQILINKAAKQMQMLIQMPAELRD